MLHFIKYIYVVFYKYIYIYFLLHNLYKYIFYRIKTKRLLFSLILSPILIAVVEILFSINCIMYIYSVVVYFREKNADLIDTSFNSPFT